MRAQNSFFNFIYQHLLTIVSCVLIVALGIVYLAYSSPGTTTIGENISTTNLLVSGNATTTGNFNILGNFSLSGVATFLNNLTVSGTTTLSTTNITGLSSVNNTIVYVKPNQTIQEVIDSITDASSTKPYVVIVPPGHEEESYINKSYIYVIHLGKFLVADTLINIPQQEYDLIISDFENETEWSGYTNYVTDSIYKHHAIQVTTSNGYCKNVDKILSTSLDLSYYDGFVLWLKASDEYISSCRIWMFTSDTDAYRIIIHPTRLPKNKWVPYFLPKPNFSIYSGNPSWSNINKIRIQPCASGSDSTSYYALLAAVKSKLPVGLITFTFDDASNTIFSNARRILDKYNYKGVFFVITSLVGTGNYVSWEDLYSLYTSGWDISSHTHTHPHLTSLSTSDIERELAVSQRILLKHGFKRSAFFFSYPYSDVDQEVANLVTKYYVAARCDSNEPILDYPFYTSPYNLHHKVITNDNISEVKDFIDKCYENKLWGILLIHSVSATGDVAEANFEEIVDYVYSKGLKVVTFSDIFKSVLPKRVSDTFWSETPLLVKTASPIPGLSGNYGTSSSILPTAYALIPQQIKLTTGGTFGVDENVTIRITANYDDSTTATVSHIFTATGDYWLTAAEMASLFKDGTYITSIDVDSMTNATSTSVTTSATIYALQQ